MQLMTRYLTTSVTLLFILGLISSVGFSPIVEPVAAAECGAERLSCAHYPESFDGVDRSSHYVDLPNGARLAVDVLRPTKGGIVANKPLPALFTHAIYNRSMRLVHNYEVQQSTLISLPFWQRWLIWGIALFQGGEMVLDQAEMMPWIGHLVRSGYIVVAVDSSGSGASYGAPLLSVDAYANESRLLMDWVISQPWSDGSIGVYGQSFHALTAYVALSTGHPALKAAFVSSPPLDSYRSVGYNGGVYNKAFGESYVAITGDLDVMATPVDVDATGEEMTKAQLGRGAFTFSDMVADIYSTAPHSDDTSRALGLTWGNLDLLSSVEGVKAAGVPVYNAGGFRDIFAKDAIFWHTNLGAPGQLVLRPWHHRALSVAGNDYDPAPHAREWFDRWMKGGGEEFDGPVSSAKVIPNSPVAYFSLTNFQGDEAKGEWCQADEWPPASSDTLTLNLRADGTLLRAQDELALSTGQVIPIEPDGATTGVDSRWNGVLTRAEYTDFKGREPGGYSFSTAPFHETVEIAGHPLASFQVRFAEGDAAVHLVLEKIAETGEREYVTEGVYLPSQSRPIRTPYNNLGLPAFDHRASQIVPVVPDEIVEFQIDLHPVALKVQAGEQLRLTVTAQDTDNFGPVGSDGSKGFEVHLGGDGATSLNLPLVECVLASNEG